MRLRRNEVYNGDCLELMRYVPSKSIDMILTDLPYGTTQNKWDSVIPLEPLWRQYERIIKDNGCIALFAQTPFTEILGASNIKLLRYKWVWKKSNVTGFLNANRMPLKQCEDILIFYKKLPTYNPQKTKCKPRKVAYPGSTSSNYGKYKADSGIAHVSDEEYPRDILEYGYDQNKIHPTQKPVALCQYLIRTYTQPGELVLDTCIGSGSTCVAAKLEGRKYIGFELDEDIFIKAKNRIEETTVEDKLNEEAS